MKSNDEADGGYTENIEWTQPIGAHAHNRVVTDRQAAIGHSRQSRHANENRQSISTGLTPVYNTTIFKTK